MIARLALAIMIAAPAAAQAPTPPPPRVDYTADASWLCRPDRVDVCSAPHDVTSVAANGALKVAPLPIAKSPAVDCFYIYPTVSTDSAGNSDIAADAAELSVATIQFAPFRGVCRTFAPLYRQVTLAALRAQMLGTPIRSDRGLAYRDVAAAWTDYLRRDNEGRGVVLIGHSQGSAILKDLIRNEIEGKDVAARLVAAYLIGTNVAVPIGRDVGGDLRSTPLCRSATQTGCIVSYVSFRDDAVPPADTRFGRATDPAMQVACTNPAALGGGRGGIDPLMPARSTLVADAAQQPVWATGATITSTYVALPGLLSAECRYADGVSYLAVRSDGDPADPRLDRIGGDVVVAGKVQAAWGLHLIDINEATGNLTRLIKTQAVAWRVAR